MKENLIKKCIFFSFIVVIIMISISIMIKYNVEGEKVLPFSIKKILLVSTVNGDVKDDPDNIWNIGVSQVNDIYVYINKTMDTDVVIDEIKFSDFSLDQAPKKGSVKLLKPTGELSNLYSYSTHDFWNEGVTFYGAKLDDLKSLEIANNGGMIGFRLSLEELGTYLSNENIEIKYDGNLLKNINITEEDVKFNVGFNITIKTSDRNMYQSRIKLDLPVEGMLEKGSSSQELTNFKNLVFKRVNEK